MAYLSRLGFWRLPVLTGIVSAPVMRCDGTILHRAGYDPQTGLFLTDDWPELAGSPSGADALAALGRLQQPFSEFPFVGPEDRSVLIAAVLTAIQRRLLSSAPLFAFSAPTQRTGKSLLAECVAIIGTGKEAPAMAASSDREELRKAVRSSAVQTFLTSQSLEAITDTPEEFKTFFASEKSRWGNVIKAVGVSVD